MDCLLQVVSEIVSWFRMSRFFSYEASSWKHQATCNTLHAADSGHGWPVAVVPGLSSQWDGHDDNCQICQMQCLKLSICQSYRWEMLRRQQAPRSYVLWYQDMYNHARHHVRSCTCFLGIFRFNQSQRCCACWLCEAWQPTGLAMVAVALAAAAFTFGLHAGILDIPWYHPWSSLIWIPQNPCCILGSFHSSHLLSHHDANTPSWDKLLGPTNVLRCFEDAERHPMTSEVLCITVLHFLWTYGEKWSWSWAYCSGSMSCYCKHPHHHAMQKRSWQLKG